MLSIVPNKLALQYLLTLTKQEISCTKLNNRLRILILTITVAFIFQISAVTSFCRVSKHYEINLWFCENKF